MKESVIRGALEALQDACSALLSDRAEDRTHAYFVVNTAASRLEIALNAENLNVPVEKNAAK